MRWAHSFGAEINSKPRKRLQFFRGISIRYKLNCKLYLIYLCQAAITSNHSASDLQLHMCVFLTINKLIHHKKSIKLSYTLETSPEGINTAFVFDKISNLFRRWLIRKAQRNRCLFSVIDKLSSWFVRAFSKSSTYNDRRKGGCLSVIAIVHHSMIFLEIVSVVSSLFFSFISSAVCDCLLSSRKYSNWDSFDTMPL